MPKEKRHDIVMFHRWSGIEPGVGSLNPGRKAKPDLTKLSGYAALGSRSWHIRDNE